MQIFGGAWAPPSTHLSTALPTLSYTKGHSYKKYTIIVAGTCQIPWPSRGSRAHYTLCQCWLKFSRLLTLSLYDIVLIETFYKTYSLVIIRKHHHVLVPNRGKTTHCHRTWWYHNFGTRLWWLMCMSLCAEEARCELLYSFKPEKETISNYLVSSCCCL